MQDKIYNSIYKDKKYVDIDLPDYKITDSKSLKGNKILVVGVGTARDTKYLAVANDVHGIDISAKATSIARKFNVKTIVSRINKKIQYKDDEFDVVVAKDILEHIENPLLLLEELRRVTKKTGYIVLSVPNHFYITFRLRNLLGKNLIWKTLGHDHTKLFEEWDYMHLRFFTWNGFQKMIRKAKLKIVKEFWDFGTLAHYSQPEMVISYHQQLETNYYVVEFLKIIWKLFNTVLPRKIRSLIVKLSPNLLCAGFYVWVKK